MISGLDLSWLDFGVGKFVAVYSRVDGLSKDSVRRGR
ncbi:MAG: hypothetical protein QOD93_6787, partial [Acetobacteraceae bacterium]|nr:hypothetical protein [Acetobacteraceae bacterium]